MQYSNQSQERQNGKDNQRQVKTTQPAEPESTQSKFSHCTKSLNEYFNVISVTAYLKHITHLDIWLKMVLVR